MIYARVFQSGNSQAVRLPKEFRFDTDRVGIFRRGDAQLIFDALTGLPADFMAQGCDDDLPQDRLAF